METQPPFPIVTGQRQLAVIMFTDAVGYSARMHEQEVATLNRLERDTGLMRRLVEAHAGAVIKSTGDGLMIQFASAVHAITCALEIQRELAARATAGVTSNPLRHRIGVHLGDVFAHAGDLMGDGVNIAARLVGEAPPGGIVISQTVFDVVKNKLPLHTMRQGPQQLKNIKDPVVTYRIMLDEPKIAPAIPLQPASVAPPAPVPAPPAPEAPTPAPRSLRPVLVLGLVLGLAGGAWFLLTEYSAHEEELDKSQSAQAKLDAMFKESSVVPAPAAAPDPAPEHDFRALTTRVPARSLPVAEQTAAVQAAEQALGPLRSWLLGALSRYTRNRPLTVTALGNPAFQQTSLFTDAQQAVYFVEGGAYRRGELTELKEPIQAAIIVQAILDSRVPVPPEVRRGAEAFAYLYGLPEMLTALPR
jgi:class 3 adenylate cyclase